MDNFSTLPTGGDFLNGHVLVYLNVVIVSITEPEQNKNFYHIYLLQPNKAQHFFQDYLPK